MLGRVGCPQRFRWLASSLRHAGQDVIPREQIESATIMHAPAPLLTPPPRCTVWLIAATLACTSTLAYSCRYVAIDDLAWAIDLQVNRVISGMEHVANGLTDSTKFYH